MNFAVCLSSPTSGCWERINTKIFIGYFIGYLVYSGAGKRHLSGVQGNWGVGDDRIGEHRAVPPATEPQRNQGAQVVRKDPVLQAAGLHQDREIGHQALGS